MKKREMITERTIGGLATKVLVTMPPLNARLSEIFTIIEQ